MIVHEDVACKLGWELIVYVDVTRERRQEHKGKKSEVRMHYK